MSDVSGTQAHRWGVAGQRLGGRIRRHLAVSVMAVSAAGLAILAVATGGQAWGSWAVPAAWAEAPPRAASQPAPRRRGAFVRIERPRSDRASLPLLCPMPDPDKLVAACFGAAPEVGDRALVFAYEGPYLGTLEVTHVGPGRMDHCNSNSTFEVTTERVGELRDQGQVSNMPLVFAIFGVRADVDKSRLMQVPDALSGLAGADAQVYMGLDSDGDATVDMVVTATECRREAPRHPAGIPGEVLCIDYWAHRSRTWIKLRRTYYYACM